MAGRLIVVIFWLSIWTRGRRRHWSVGGASFISDRLGRRHVNSSTATGAVRLGAATLPAIGQQPVTVAWFGTLPRWLSSPWQLAAIDDDIVPNFKSTLHNIYITSVLTSIICYIYIYLTNIHEQIKQRHWCKQRDVPCARMRCSSTQVFRLAECYVPRWTLQCSPGNIEILSLRFKKCDYTT